MNVIWHLIRKDLHRLRWPLVLFSLLLVGEILFYASIAGLIGAPDLGWLQRSFSGPEVLLRTLAQPLIAYFFVGWLVFDDSPVEKDAHWITRPISGAQQFAAKAGAAVLMLILWPLVLNILWWIAGGCSGHEILISAREFVGFYGVLISLGLACAALTDGFPRFILWSFVGFIVFAMVQLTFNLSDGPASGLVLSRILIGGLVSSLVALGIALHQFATRRYWRSLALVCVGVLVAGLTSGWWSWDFLDYETRFAPRGPSAAGVNVKLTGPVQLQQKSTRYFARVPLEIDGLPEDALVERLKATGDWSFAGERVWSSQLEFRDVALGRDAVRRQLGLTAPVPQDNQVVLPLKFSLPLAERAAREPAALHLSVGLALLHGRLVAELPLRATAKPAGARGCTISEVAYGPRKKRPAAGSTPVPIVVSFLVTERSAGGFRDNAMPGPGAFQYALVNRGTGEFFLRDPVRSGPVAYTMLNQVKVTCWRLEFPTGTVRLEDLTLAILRFDRGEWFLRDLNLNPVTLIPAAP